MPRRNIGVAIAVPPPYGAELADWRAHFGDPQARLVPTHVTLLPPTAITGARLPVIEEHLRAVARDEVPFEVLLRGSGTFRPVSPVTFVALASGISACERLEDKVRSGPLARDLKFNYHPHVTVAHDLDDVALDKAFEELASYEAKFSALGFTLFEEGRDRAWRPLVDFTFGES
ncbi:MAG: 2'-5' RNA ligase family protein [Mycobacteriales bacterium]